MVATSRLLLGNLDAELDFARVSRPGVTRTTLPRGVLEALAGFATLLRVFARNDDELRTLAPVAPERMADVSGLPRPRLSAGKLTTGDRDRSLLAWAETTDVAACRGPIAAVADDETPLWEEIWNLPTPDAEDAARVNHRGFYLAVTRDLGCALPGARIVASPAELGPDAWVLKACHSAAGRSRFVHRGGGGLDAKDRRTIERLFTRHGPLLLEPWMDRVDDFGVAALLTPETVRVAGFHRQLVDRRGRFTGVELDVEGAAFAELTDDERRQLRETIDGVAHGLRAAGYVGPFGIDCWRHRRSDGTIAFHPLGEINARMTFGLVARALIDRIRGPLGLAPEAHIRIVFGRGSAGAGRRIPLLLPDAAGVAVELVVL